MPERRAGIMSPLEKSAGDEAMNERAFGLLMAGVGILLGIIFALVTGLLGDAVNALREFYQR